MPLSCPHYLRRGVFGLFFWLIPAVCPASYFTEQLDRLEVTDPEVASIIERARRLADGPILKRTFSLEDMGEHLDGRRANTVAKADAVRDRIGDGDALRYALASGDMAASRAALDELPLMAAAVRLTGEVQLKDYLERQLAEVVTWKPFQRPGWSLPHRQSPLPPEGDGVWLATGTLIQALTLTLAVLPENTLSAKLDVAVRTRIGEEVKLTLSDWNAGVPWYVNSDRANSNQWVVPASGLVIGAAFLGRENHRAAYELGVASLRKSLALAGDDGSLNEGYAYGMSWTSFSLMLSSRFMADVGDASFAEAGFFKNFPKWVALYFQPGGNPVNSFDGFGAQRGSLHLELTNLTRLAAVSGSEALVALVQRECGALRRDYFGLLAHGLLDDNSPTAGLPLSGLFQRSHMFVWRSSAEFDASGFWIRGGDKHDFHDHFDRGHVNFIAAGVPVLIESGTPGYAHARKRSHYDSALGHNVFRVNGNAFPAKAPAPITHGTSDDEGGRVSVDLQRVHSALSKAVRAVRWRRDSVEVEDTLAAPKPVRVDWVWHFASNEEPEVQRIDARRVKVSVPAGRMVFPAWIGRWVDPDLPEPEGDDLFKTAAITVEFESDHPITVEVGRSMDHTLKFRRQENRHVVLNVTGIDVSREMVLRTRVGVSTKDQQ